MHYKGNTQSLRLLQIGGCSVPRARNRIHCQPRRRLPGILRAHEPEDEEEAVEEVAVEEVVDPASLINSNPQFAAVFKSALQRTGPGVLNKGPPPDDPKYGTLDPSINDLTASNTLIKAQVQF